MRIRMIILGTLTAVAGPACDRSGAGGVGAPCNVDEDCEGALICDEHDGQSSCQLPHGHDDDPDDAEGTGEHGPDSGAHETSGPDSDGHETGGPEPGGSGSDPEGGSSGDAAAECQSFCGCMAASCAGFDAYPFADEAGCMDFCADLDPTRFTCFFGFCETAATEPNEGLQEHWCEHAWGQQGDDEC